MRFLSVLAAASAFVEDDSALEANNADRGGLCRRDAVLESSILIYLCWQCGRPKISITSAFRGILLVHRLAAGPGFSSLADFDIFFWRMSDLCQRLFLDFMISHLRSRKISFKALRELPS